MAQRRMFSKQITDSDLFLDMPASAQNLYFHLNMHADDDGFLGNSRTIRRMVGASEDDFKVLVAKGFLIIFSDGVSVIRDWHIHNYIQKDRYHETVYQEDKKSLTVNDNRQYELLGIGYKRTLDTKCIHDVSEMDTQVRLESGQSQVSLESGNIRSESGQSSQTKKIEHDMMTENKLKELKIRAKQMGIDIQNRTVNEEFSQFIKQLGYDLSLLGINKTSEYKPNRPWNYLKQVYQELLRENEKMVGATSRPSSKHIYTSFNHKKRNKNCEELPEWAKEGYKPDIDPPNPETLAKNKQLLAELHQKKENKHE